MNEAIDSWIRKATVVAMVALAMVLLGAGVALVLPAEHGPAPTVTR